MAKRPRMIALFIAAAFVLVTLSSMAFIALEADHDCTGEDCPVCYHINICKNTLKLGLAFAVLVPAGLTVAVICPSVLLATGIATCPTLITLKVKLSN